VRKLLEIYGISMPPEGLAQTSQEAVALARQIGFPVALKIISPDIPHKTDIGGVLLGIQDEASVHAGFEQIMANAKRAQPEASIVGISIQRMIPQGQEVIVGAVQDAQFGPLVMFGSGGIEVEGLKDVAFALAPITEEEVGYLLDSTWGGRKLNGYRNIPPADQASVKETIYRLAQLAADLPQIQEIEINPLRVLEGGAYALDVRARL
jgi:acetyltransferase